MSAQVSYDPVFREDRVIKTVKDVNAAKFIEAFSQHLKRQGKFEIPKWADIVTTGVHKELAPYDPDWLYIRAASMVRKIYIRGGVGTGAFRKIYGGQKRRGTMTNTFQKASGSICRYVLQQLQNLDLIEEAEDGGRKITREGQRELDTVAVQALKEAE